jgi:CRP-like cAMP-binding protein
MSTVPHQFNHILKRLPQPDYDRIVGQMERVVPPLGEILAEAGVPPKWVHFPRSAVLSSIVVLENGDTVEGSTLGNEGMDGLCLLSESLDNPYRINVQVEGELLRMPAAAFKRVLAESSAMLNLLMRYAFVSIQRGSQNGACIQHHTIEERMCRWLLETAHRKGADQFHLTQEFLADMLGVRRQGVNLTARVLQTAGLIKYARGEMTILNRAGLEETSCECFRVTTAMYEHVMRLPPTTAKRSTDGVLAKRPTFKSAVTAHVAASLPPSLPAPSARDPNP